MIVFIDDEARRMSSYAEELEFDLNKKVHFETDIDSALNFLSTQNAEIDLIILDVMMSPGISFQKEDSEYGLKTGLLLYRKIRSHNTNVPIVLFTNASDANVAKEVEDDKKCLFFQKEDFLPSEFSGELKRFLSL